MASEIWIQVQRVRIAGAIHLAVMFGEEARRARESGKEMLENELRFQQEAMLQEADEMTRLLNEEIDFGDD